MADHIFCLLFIVAPLFFGLRQTKPGNKSESAIILFSLN